MRIIKGGKSKAVNVYCLLTLDKDSERKVKAKKHHIKPYSQC